MNNTEEDIEPELHDEIQIKLERKATEATNRHGWMIECNLLFL